MTQNDIEIDAGGNTRSKHHFLDTINNGKKTAERNQI